MKPTFFRWVHDSGKQYKFSKTKLSLFGSILLLISYILVYFIHIHIMLMVNIRNVDSEASYLFFLFHFHAKKVFSHCFPEKRMWTKNVIACTREDLPEQGVGAGILSGLTRQIIFLDQTLKGLLSSTFEILTINLKLSKLFSKKIVI